MNIYLTIFYISSIIWIFPVFRQRKTEYIKYFIVLAVADPLGMLLYRLTHFPIQIYAFFVIALMLSALSPPKYHLKNAVLSMIASILLWVCTLNSVLIHGFDSILLLAIIVLLCIRFVKKLIIKKVNLFLALLIFYNIISFLRMFSIVLNYEQGAISSIIGNAFQIIFGILFTFINVNTKNFKLNIR